MNPDHLLVAEYWYATVATEDAAPAVDVMDDTGSQENREADFHLWPSSDPLEEPRPTLNDGVIAHGETHHYEGPTY
jgi:hypothetical protein